VGFSWGGRLTEVSRRGESGQSQRFRGVDGDGGVKGSSISDFKVKGGLDGLVQRGERVANERDRSAKVGLTRDRKEEKDALLQGRRRTRKNWGRKGSFVRMPPG